MHEGTASVIREAAPFLLTPEARKWKWRRYLKDPLRNALDILEILHNEWQTAEEISLQMPEPIAAKNVSFILRVLAEEGHSIESRKGKGWRLLLLRQ